MRGRDNEGTPITGHRRRLALAYEPSQDGSQPTTVVHSWRGASSGRETLQRRGVVHFYVVWMDVLGQVPSSSTVFFLRFEQTITVDSDEDA